MMRLRVLGMLFAVVILAAAPSYAQAVGGGAKIGVNFANISESSDSGEDADFERRTGLAIGGFADVGVTEMMSFQPEVLFTQKGAKLEEDDGSEFELSIDGVQIPLLLRFNFGTGAARPFVVVGPAFNFITSAEIEFEGEEEDIKDDVASVDVSGVVGLGVQFGRALVEARYDHGFNDLDDESDDSEARSRTFSILAGVGF